MGTSQSSSGSPSNTPLVPPWVPDIPLPNGGDGSDESANQPSPEKPNASQHTPLAPVRRFGSTRTHLGRFAVSGSQGDMRRGLGQYVNKGLGGARTATRRLGGTSRTAGALYKALSDIAGGRAVEGGPVDFALLRGRSANEVIDAVVEAVRPIDGTQDAEASRRSVRDALSEVLKRFPEADLLDLSEEQRLLAIETYVALDVYGRFNLDVGKSIQNKAPSVAVALSRLKEIKGYIRQEVSAAFRRLRGTSENLSADRIVGMVRQALQSTFQVFEDYVL